MAKLKSFEQYVSEKEANIDQDAVNTQEVQEATVVMDAVDPKSKGLAKLLKKNNVSIEVVTKVGPSGWPEVELTGDRKDLEIVLADSQYGWDDADLAEYIEESKDTFTVKVKSIEEGAKEEEIEEGNAFGDAVRKAKEAGDKEFEFDGKTYKVEESEEVKVEEEEEEEGKEESEEEVNENPAAAIAVASMLKEVYEACKNEAKVWEDDAHDSHTIESYMAENAALVASLAAKSLKEMKDEYSTEAFEAACNSMIESYTTKINEMKESELADDAADVE
tara:strand:+ start:963 stop:1793 length:831 start_codon:yes stop_codon:yes gene_type:complete